MKILLADGRPPVADAICALLWQRGHEVVVVLDAGAALRALAETIFDVVVADVALPGAGGYTVSRRVREIAPHTDVILTNGASSITEASAAMKERASDYLAKADPERVARAVDTIAQRRSSPSTLPGTNRTPTDAFGNNAIIGTSIAMQRLRDRLLAVAASEAAVLLTGESGTGKELAARMVHACSDRASAAFVAVNCAAFPETLIEAELFGHVKGAFTGAIAARKGRFEAADGGTLFLDEIAELPLDSQAKLLRVLQEGIFQPVGTNRDVKVDVRLIAATNRDLKQRISVGRFRDDLYYRLKVLEVDIPPLRERKDDVPLLIEHFLRRYAHGAGATSISPAAWAALTDYPYPGNVRELEHAIAQAVVLSRGGVIHLEHLPSDIRGAAPFDVPDLDGGGEPQSLAGAVQAFERQYILRTLAAVGGNRSRAAHILRISRKSLWKKMRAYGIGADEAQRPR